MRTSCTRYTSGIKRLWRQEDVKLPNHPSFPRLHSLAGRLGLRGRLRIFGGQKILGVIPQAYVPQSAALILHHRSAMVACIDLMPDRQGGKLRHSGKPRYSTA
jgi:hypothetical protein